MNVVSLTCCLFFRMFIIKGLVIQHGVNRCRFHIVEFFNSHHSDPNNPAEEWQNNEQFQDDMLRFEKKSEIDNPEFVEVIPLTMTLYYR